MMRDYVTFNMAYELLGHGSPTGFENKPVYDLIEKHDIEVKSIGRMKLINREQLARAAGVSPDGEPRWPVFVAWLPEDQLLSTSETASRLGVTRRHVNYLVKTFGIEAYTLQEWGGQTVIPTWAAHNFANRRSAIEKFVALKNRPRYGGAPHSNASSSAQVEEAVSEFLSKEGEYENSAS